MAPGVRIALRHPAELRPQFADSAPMVVHRLTVGDPQCLFEKRIHEGGPVKINAVLSRAGHRDLVLATRRNRDTVILPSPVGPNSSGPQSHSGTPRLRTGKQNGIGATGCDIKARLVHQRLRGVPTDSGVLGTRIPCPDPLLEKKPGVAIAPRQQIHHADGIQCTQNPGIGGFGGRSGHQVNRFDIR